MGIFRFLSYQVGMADIEKLVDDVMETVSELGDDMDVFTQRESMEFYEGVAHQCNTRAQALLEELDS